LRARWYAPATGRFTQVDPFVGLLSLPGTQHPYAYALNNPLRYTDPSGEFVGALLGGLAIGAVVGGVSYALQHRGQPIACFLRDPNFWRAAAVGGISGTVSGFVAGFFAPLMLLSSGVGTAMQIGGLIGMLASFSSHVVTNVLYGRPVAEGLGWAMLSGAVFGALGGAVGWTIRQGLTLSYLKQRASQVHGVLDPIAQTRRTTAVLQTDAGRIVASGVRDLTPAQRALLGSGEIAAKLPGAHAEVTALQAAQRLGATPRAMVVTRVICPQCTAVIEASGGTLTSPTTAIWFGSK